MKILVTGANGMVARATIDYCKSIGDQVLAYSRPELNIADRRAVFAKLEREKPDAVINCAAYTDVDACETNHEKAYQVNSYGVENLATACRKIKAGFVTISTDYVFDGEKEGFYTQRDDPHPPSVYGQAKLDGEIRVRNAYARTILVRSGWIFGEHGTNFLSKLVGLLMEGQSIKAIKDSFGTPTFGDDLAKRLRELAELDLPGIYHVVNSGEGTSYLNYAQAVEGINPELVIAVTADSLKRPAPRPRNSKMRCLLSEKIGLEPLPFWKEALKRFQNKSSRFQTECQNPKR
jgi:dTDP-4-dehydrorhamnose reductase